MKSVRTIAVTALLVAIFLSLANWQWNRASDMKKPIKLDNRVYKLEDIANPATEISDSSIHKLVEARGKYLFTKPSPNQNGKTWDVSLLQTDANDAVLVVRGIEGSNQKEVTNSIVTGRYFPPQGNDLSAPSMNTFSRVDSALVAGQTKLPLYAGFILAIKEQPSAGYIPAKLGFGSKIPGFYWQHISYVIIWLLFAVVVLYLPRYQRKLDRGL